MLKDNDFTPHMIVHVHHRTLCCVEDRMSIHDMVRTVLVRSEYPCDPEQMAPVDEWLRTLNRTSSRRCVFVANWCHVWDKPSSACGWSGGWIVKMIRGKGNLLRYWGTMYMYIVIYAICSKVCIYKYNTCPARAGFSWTKTGIVEETQFKGWYTCFNLMIS